MRRTVRGRLHYYDGVVEVQENDADDIAALEQLFARAGLDWKDYTTDEALAVLGGEYAMGYLNIEGTAAILTWKEPSASPEEVLAEAEQAFRAWADEQGYDPWFGEATLLLSRRPR